MENIQPQSNISQNVDQQALHLTHAIALSETGKNGKPDYTASGASGEKGGYQWMPGNFESDAKTAGLDPNDFSPANQDKVAYSVIKAYKDKGYDPGQIASLWNSGSPNNWQDHSGINKEGVHYDTPAYVQNVKKNYQKLSGNQPNIQGYNPHPYSNPTSGSNPGAINLTGASTQSNQTPSNNTDTLGDELGKRVNQGSDALKSIAEGEQSGSSRLSGVIQLAGAAAGAVGDVVNKGIELIPGVKWVEGIIGKGVGALAQTAPGQAIVKSIKDFSTAHPELSKDIGAGFNILTAIPILKGLSTIGNVALDASSSALKGVAEKVATKDLTATAERTIAGRSALKSAPDAIKTLIDERAIPDIADGKYTTKDAFDKLSHNITQIEDTELQPALAQASTQSASQRVPIEQLRQEALAAVKEEFKSGGQVGKATAEVNRVIDDYKGSYGDYVSLQDINDMKRGIRQTVNFSSPKLESDVTYHLGQVFQKNIEESATKLGLGDIKAINQKMAHLIKSQNLLKHIEGKPIKTGLVGGLIKDAATVGGEVAGNSSGIPLAGAYLGRSGGGYVGKKLAGISKGILERTGKDAVRTTTEKSLGRTKGLLIGTLGQKSIR